MYKKRMAKGKKQSPLECDSSLPLSQEEACFRPTSGQQNGEEHSGSKRPHAITALRADWRLREDHGKRRSRSLLPFAFCPLPFDFPIRLLPTALCFLLSTFRPLTLCLAQEPPAQPYAAINRGAVSYNGPGRDVTYDFGGSEIRIGLLAPLTGPRQAEGEALRHGAEMAVAEENANSLTCGRRLVLSIGDESGPWGRVSSAVVNLVVDDQAVAIITSADGGSAHLAEQVANKIGVPVLTFSTDATTTEINLPWIFRLGPTDVEQAQAFAQDIYHDRNLKRVALLVQDDHDGRVGSEEFEKVAREMNAAAPMRITVGAGPPDAEALQARLREAETLVVWADAATANLLMARVREVLPSVPIYLCRKAVQGDSVARGSHFPTGSTESTGIWTAEETPAEPAMWKAFATRYKERFGIEPGMDAAQAYDAVRVLAASLRRSGPNRARLRDALAQVSGFGGPSGIISFDPAGNDLSQVRILELR